MNLSSWKFPQTNWNKSADGLVRMGSRWTKISACAMGISLFLRMMYYFGLVNLRDLPGWDVAVQVWIPLLLSVAYLLLVRFVRRTEAIFTGGLLAALAVNYCLMVPVTFWGIVSGIWVLLVAAGFVLLSLGIVPVPNSRNLLTGLATGAVVFRALSVDLFGCILPLTKFNPIAYVAEAANLAMVFSIAVVCLALRLRPLNTNEA